MSNQKIRLLKVSDLHLWTENPRDPVDTQSTDIDIIKRALVESPDKWNLPKMIGEMGAYYDYSELPTVVIEEGTPIVYDGNRRVAVLKYIQNPTAFSDLEISIKVTSVQKELKNQKEIPCNVCDKDTALTNVERKHVSAGTWGPLERDYFLTMHRETKRSLFVQFEEQTGNAISQNKKMNQGFVKKEVLTERNLKEIGIHLDPKKGLVSAYSGSDMKDIIERITAAVNAGKIATRGPNRGKLKETLLSEYPDLKAKLKPFDNSEPNSPINLESGVTSAFRKTQRSRKKSEELFGGNLSLRNGAVNDIYRDISDLFIYYNKNREHLSETFPSLIRMSLRLLVEAAAEHDLDAYIRKNFALAKNALSQDQKTTLSNHSIDEKKLIQLLHTGAHAYASSTNLSQTISMSLIIGYMIGNTHAKL